VTLPGSDGGGDRVKQSQREAKEIRNLKGSSSDRATELSAGVIQRRP